jgi:hypothetical protein
MGRGKAIFYLSPSRGIYGAADRQILGSDPRVTIIASDTFADFLFPVFQEFPGKIGIGQNGPSQSDQVRNSALYHGGYEARMQQLADGNDRHPGSLFYRSRRLQDCPQRGI